MRVKRYVVDTMPEAMLQIRGDLGTDAVILSTKEMKVGGFMGMFSKENRSGSCGRGETTSKATTVWIIFTRACPGGFIFNECS